MYFVSRERSIFGCLTLVNNFTLILTPVFRCRYLKCALLVLCPVLSLGYPGLCRLGRICLIMLVVGGCFTPLNVLNRILIILDLLLIGLMFASLTDRQCLLLLLIWFVVTLLIAKLAYCSNPSCRTRRYNIYQDHLRPRLHFQE